ncbi:stabilin-2-like isoform X2 [Mya arenaria]|uniref:stabilin-2-like isoform X2 n=1 Tax=Mya arenaria TaxID=6604 RepID=UPI0022E5798D|nr:stabilin-2-like isoform X2 [Mya arenaria]
MEECLSYGVILSPAKQTDLSICLRSCPGGVESPCSGHGQCDDRLNGTGKCTCQPGWSGGACELCDSKYNNCTGDGDQSSCSNVTCPDNTRCYMIDGKSHCLCEWPYMDKENSTAAAENITADCEKIDICTVPPHCHSYANCTMTTAPTADNLWKMCTCWTGYHGDGFQCDPDDPCQVNNGDCHDNTTICRNTAPGERVCDCKPGYHEHQLDTGCSLIDICMVNTSACHPKANCETVAPLTVECTCPKGYMGDGHICVGNLLQTIRDLNGEDPDLKGKLSLIEGAMSKYYARELTEHGPFTMFVPINDGFRSINTGDYGKWLDDGVQVRKILREHLLPGEFTLDKLTNTSEFHTLQGTPAEILVNQRTDVMKYRILGSNRKAALEKWDIPASNGIIHVIDRLLVINAQDTGFPNSDILENIKQYGQYNRLESLITTAGDEITSILVSPNITLFAPINSAWDTLPMGSLEFLNSPEGRSHLVAILKDHIYQGVLEVTDIVNMRLLMSMAGTVSYVYISPTGLLKVNNHANLLQADIAASNGLIHEISEVKVPNGVSTLPNYCDIETYSLVKGACRDCREDMKCYGDDAMTDILEPCQYLAKNAEEKYDYYPGCAVMCNRTFYNKQCCDNFYGIDCLPCPGGHKNPCSGHGKCNDGYHSDGVCICDENFGGPTCDRCADKKRWGENCTQECTCLRGNCSSRDGRCEVGTCESGYHGENCEYTDFGCYDAWHYCHAHAQCIWQEEQLAFDCICKAGYQGPGTYCDPINVCQLDSRGGCHLQATCEMTGPGTANCTCNPGYSGDGSDCLKDTACYSHTHCHQHGSCVNEESGSVCRCDDGFYGNGTYCEYTDRCAVGNGGCDPRATCMHADRSKPYVNCSCPLEKGLSGSGFHCYGNLIMELGSLNETMQTFKLLQHLQKYDRDLLLNGNYTVFAIANEGIVPFMQRYMADQAKERWWGTKDNILTLLNYHTVAGSHSLDELVKVSSIRKVDTMADGFSLYVTKGSDGVVKVMPKKTGTVASVIKSDIIATNGYIHVIDKVLEPYEPVDPDNYPELADLLAQNPQYSIFTSWLKEYGLIETIEKMNEYTLFVPNDAAASRLNRTMTRALLGSFIHSSLVYMFLAEDGQLLISEFEGSLHRIDFTENNGELYANGIHVVKQDMFTYGGMVNEIDGLFHPIFNNCDNKIVTTTKGPCAACRGTDYSCVSPSQLPVEKVDPVSCFYAVRTSHGSITEQQGCQGICVTETIEKGCCEGYFGLNCSDCPGGPETPCHGHGVCSDGSRGNGTCTCEPKFIGLDCNTCIEGWAGKNCDIDKSSCGYKNGGCDVNAVCSQNATGAISCVCDAGYNGDGYNCSGPCSYGNGGCHKNASCSYYVATGIRCQCEAALVGDGKKYCNSDVLSTLQILPTSSMIYQMITNLAEDSDLKSLLSAENVPNQKLTMFVPIDNTLKNKVLPVEALRKQLVVSDHVTTLNSVDFKNFSLTTVSNETLYITYNLLEHAFYVNKSKVVEGNIPCTNGVIHFVSSSFTPPIPLTKSVSARSFPLATVLGIVGACVFIAVIGVAGILLYRKSQSGYWQLLQEWVAKKRESDGVIQDQSPLNVDDKEDQPLSGLPSNTNFDNPLFTQSD